MEIAAQLTSLVFALTTLLTVFLFYKAANYSKVVLFTLFVWLAAQGFIALSGFYTHTNVLPPRFALAILPPLIFIVYLISSQRGRQFTASLDLKTLTLLHTIRIPVELVLLWLFIQYKVPQLMTFEGRNFDILSGITAPLVYYFGFVKPQWSKKIVLVWNFICLGLLINIVMIAIFSAPFPFQKLAFEQPNIAVFYFPFVWLPCCVVPLVLLSHLSAIQQLLGKE